MFGTIYTSLVRKPNRRWWSLLGLAALLMGASVPLSLMNYGIDAPTPVGAYLNGLIPSATPSGVSSWKVVLAYPNLTFTDPVDMLEVPGTNLFMIAGKKGKIWTFDKRDTTITNTSLNVAVDIESQVYTAGDAGLLGIVFHPEFNQPSSPNANYFYVFYRYTPVPKVSGNRRAYCRLSRFTMNRNTMKASSEYVLIQQYDRHDWHNGGQMFFDPEGFLYLPIGDEGGANDEYLTSQRLDSGLLGGILRIDVDRDVSRSHPIRRQPRNPGDNSSDSPRPSGWPTSFSQGYYIPNDNPWQAPDSSHLEEFWAIGLRSPHRMTYDSITGNIWIGDIGQGNREEITVLGKAENAQWPYMEGNRVNTQSYMPKPTNIIGTERPPVYDYKRDQGTCVIGGFVYRGNRYPSLYGKYLFGDHTVRKVWYLEEDPNTGQLEEHYMVTIPQYDQNGIPLGTGGKSGISHLATDSTGEIYVLKLYGTDLDGGQIYKIRPDVSTPEPPALLSQLNIFKDLSTLEPQDYMIPYELNEPFWSDDALKFRWMIIPNNGTHNTASEQIEFSADGDWNFPQGAVMVKHFELKLDETQPTTSRRIETRLLVKGLNDEFYGVTYRWRPDGSDAELLNVAQLDTLAINTPHGDRRIHWYYPDRGDCMFCHNQGARSVLGPKTRQLNGDIQYFQSGRTANQLKTLTSLNLFDSAPDTANLSSYLTSANKDNQTASVELRARTYLDANCAYCHRPSNAIQAYFDARLSTPLAEQGLIYGQLYANTGSNDPKRVLIPGDKEHSHMYQRLAAVHNQLAMPPLAKNLMDTAGVELLEDWIASMDPSYGVGAAVVVADYVDDFQGPAPSPGWEYLWNSGGPIGNDANYGTLNYNGALYDTDGINNGFPDAGNLAWGNLSSDGGHPGRAQGQGQTTDRLVIAAYTVPSNGAYALTNALVTDANSGCGDGAEVVVYVNNTLINQVSYPNGGSATFNGSLGNLIAGDKIYVAHGPRVTTDACDGFNWDFTIVRTQAHTGQRISFSPLPNMRTGDPNVLLTATASSGLPVTYTVVSGPATISGSTLSLTGSEGEVIIRAAQSGNGTYLEAPVVERSFWIGASQHATGTGLLGNYFSDKDMNVKVFDRVDPQIDFYWGNSTPDTRLGYDEYAVVWEGEIESPVSELMTFTTTTDDGVRLYVNNQLIIDRWGDQEATSYTGTINMQAWVRVPIRMEFYENHVYASASLGWTSNSLAFEPVPSIFLYPAAESSFPVELLSFWAEKKVDYANLQWTTATEIESDYFDVERAIPGTDQFEVLGRVEAAGTSQTERHYAFSDYQPTRGVNLYRLKQVDLDGTAQHSEVVSLLWDRDVLSVYPNPTQMGESLTLRVNLSEAQALRVNLVSLSGVIAHQQTLDYTGGNRQYSLDTHHLAAGTYLVVLQTHSIRKVEKIVIK